MTERRAYDVMRDCLFTRLEGDFELNEFTSYLVGIHKNINV